MRKKANLPFNNTLKARKVHKGNALDMRMRDTKNAWEKSYEARVERESEGPLIPDWMKDKKAIGLFLLLFLALTLIAFILSTLRYIFFLTGIIVMIGSYFFGGGLSEWHSIPPTTTTSARSMLEYRYSESASNWEIIIAGLLIGGIIFTSALLGMLADMLI